MRRREAALPVGAVRGGHIPFVPRSKKVLELSLRESLRLRHKHIGSEHLLLGLLNEGEGLAAQILVESGLSLADLRDRTLRALRKAA
jgi:ATP-dependent Clp protease ATP-binding subunit ClpA